jgi:hypothetical protein
MEQLKEEAEERFIQERLAEIKKSGDEKNGNSVEE